MNAPTTTSPDKKKLILALIPVAIAATLLLYTWIIILFTGIFASWRHYTGLLLFLPLPWLTFKKFKAGLLAQGVYFILGTFNLYSLTPSSVTVSYGARIGSLNLSTPDLQPWAVGLLILYLILNFGTLIDIYVSYTMKE